VCYSITSGPVSHTELALTDKWKGMKTGNQGQGEGTKEEEEERTDVGEARRPNAIT
jgi:hypothetical protein